MKRFKNRFMKKKKQKDIGLPKYFKAILWFTEFERLSLEKDRHLILFQAFEKGRMEHLRYLASKLGGRALYNFARRNARRFSRKSILPFARVVFSGT